MAKESIAAKVDPQTKRKFRVKAAMEDKTMSQYVSELIERETDGCDIEIPS